MHKDKGVPRLALMVAYYSLVLALLSVPAAFGFLYVYLYGVNVVFWDGWEIVDLFDKMFSGSLGLSDLVAQHNEHRILFPRIVMLSLGLATNYNAVAEMYFIQGCLVAMLIALLLAFRGHARYSALAFLPIALLLFSPRQYENMLWGFQVGFAMVLAFSIFTFFLLYIVGTRSFARLAFLAALASGTVAAFSSQQGLLVWPVGLLQLLLLPRETPSKKAAIGIWSLVGAGEWILYFLDYTRPDFDKQLHALAHPLKGAEYFLTVLGGSLFWQQSFAIVGGLVVATIIALGLWMVYRNRVVADHSLWIALILFSLASAAGTTVSRMGMAQAVTSRYASFSILAVIGVYAVLTLLAFEKRSLSAAVLVGVLSGLFLVSLPISYLEGIRAGQETEASREEMAFILSTYQDQPDVQLQRLYPSAETVRERARILKKHNYSVFSEGQSQASLPPLSKLSPAEATTESKVGYINDTPVGQEEPTVAIPQEARFVTVTGWAVDARAKEAAGGVYVDVDGKRIPAYYGLERKDVAQAFKEPAYRDSGFRGTIRVSKIGQGTHRLSIVVLTSDREKYYRSHQQVDLEVQ